MQLGQVTGLVVPNLSTRRTTGSAALPHQSRHIRPRLCARRIRIGLTPVSPRLSSATPALQQRDSLQSATRQPQQVHDSDFDISLKQLQRLAGSRGSYLFEDSEYNNTSQLAETLRVSLEFGLVNDASDLAARRDAFGSNRLPDKEEVSQQAMQ